MISECTVDFASTPVYPSPSSNARDVGVSAAEYGSKGPKKTRGSEKREPRTLVMPEPSEILRYAWLYRSTIQQLSVLRERAAEGKELPAANDFARYVLNSGILDILQPFDQADSTGAIKIDSAFLRWTAEDLRRVVCESFKRSGAAPGFDVSTLENINRKLDIIAAEIARRKQ